MTMSENRQIIGCRHEKMRAMDDFERCYRAVQSRDPRFDGWFFTAVTTTRIYCRPSCPARTPMRDHVRFYPSAAAAQQDGFRACLRCRPDAAPGSPEWLGRADVAARAVKLVLNGTIDTDGVPGLAKRLGYSERQLHRVLVSEVGTGALALARAQRAQTARTLLETTDVPVADVAFAAGFKSIRQFNDTVKQIFGRAPTELRRAANTRSPARGANRRVPTAEPAVALRLAHRRPFAAGACGSSWRLERSEASSPSRMASTGGASASPTARGPSSSARLTAAGTSTPSSSCPTCATSRWPSHAAGISSTSIRTPRQWTRPWGTTRCWLLLSEPYQAVGWRERPTALRSQCGP